jgi:hypothetical protein
MKLDRREVIKWMLAAAAGLAYDGKLHAEGGLPPAAGYGLDPNLLRVYQPGDLWPLTLQGPARRTAAALCDAIIPADEHSPAATGAGVLEFIDEWVSAPYPEQRKDRELILWGLAWIDAEAVRRWQVSFADVAAERRDELCAELCSLPPATSERRKPAEFFARYRDLTSGGFYTTPVGFKDLGYVGNRPSLTYDGPPPELIRQLGLEDAAG